MDGDEGKPSNAALLHAAATNGQLEIVRELLKRGATVDLPTSLGCTALMDAAYYGQPSVLLVLLQHLANPDLQDDEGSTALMQAAGRAFKEHGALIKETGTLQDLLQDVAGELQDGAAAVVKQLAKGAPVRHERGACEQASLP